MPGQTALDDGQADKLLAGLAQDAKSPLPPGGHLRRQCQKNAG